LRLILILVFHAAECPIKKLMDKFGYVPERDCFKMMHIDGKEFLELTKLCISPSLHMLIAWHLFEAVIELLENNGEQYNEENTPYILWRNQGVIDPPMAFGLLITYILNRDLPVKALNSTYLL
jgi:hypothetical protein